MSEEAKKRFNKVLARKTLVLERGLKLDANLDEDMVEMIAERNWFKLVEQPRLAVISIVKELYANAIKHVDHVVQVRGKLVAFDSDTINAYYGLDNPKNSYEHSHSGLNSIIISLCKPGTQWTMKVGTNKNVTFPHLTLSRHGKAWYAFLCAKFMPTRHQNDVLRHG